MKITAITAQVKDPNRVNVLVEGKYRFSLDIFQVGELGLKVGKDYSEAELVSLEEESIFGRLYARALEYTMLRPHSAKEVRDYLWRKTLTTKSRNRKTGEWKERLGVSQEVTERVFTRLVDKGYVNDEKFARFWVDNRKQRTGTSFRKLRAELLAKGVAGDIITETLQSSDRDEKNELQKVIEKKAGRYADREKLMKYLIGLGFSYDEVKDALSGYQD